MSLDPENYDAGDLGSLLHLHRHGHSHSHNHRHDHRVELHEHRAPTDESLRLLKEMEQQVRDNLLATYVVPLTPCKVVLHRLKDASAMGIGHRWIGRFNLNGREFQVNCLFSEETTFGKSKVDVLRAQAEGVMKQIGEEIARVLVHEGLQHMDRLELEG